MQAGGGKAVREDVCEGVVNRFMTIRALNGLRKRFSGWLFVKAVSGVNETARV